jgi:allophanate hydrolase subunit 2
LKEANLTGPAEKLAHVGLMFDTGAEFDAEIRRRSIDPRWIKVLSAGQRQVFVPDENGVYWEISCS